MMIKCPNCGKEIVLAQQDDMEPTLWNFDGSHGEVEVTLYCEDCDEIFKAEIGYNMTPTGDIRIVKEICEDEEEDDFDW